MQRCHAFPMTLATLPQYASASLGETFGFRLPERLLDGCSVGRRMLNRQPHFHNLPSLTAIQPRLHCRRLALQPIKGIVICARSFALRRPLLFSSPRQPACLLVTPRSTHSNTMRDTR
jgi:hypothetical protein